MEPSLQNWLAELDRYAGRIPLQVLASGLKKSRVDLKAVQPFVQPIHDHRGSACAVKIISGAATETVFEMTEEGRLFEIRARNLSEGFICVRDGGPGYPSHFQ